ncbi:MAG TPA: dTMP kinase [Verrucomicrobiae bacterium]|nr:dTMP kinase [Verrucomicrobiae bacterium]
MSTLRTTRRRFYGHGIPGVNPETLTGKLIVVEGADGSGRSTQIARLVDWLETCGHATVQVGLKRSTLVSAELEKAQEGNILSRTTLSLFYATDFADQLENIILPALKAGFIVLADRYIYTLMARDLVRGMDEKWLQNLYGIALEPDAVFYLSVEPQELVQRNLAKKATLDYWESGMDLGLSRDMFDSFLKYQAQMQAAFRKLQKTYGFQIVDANRPVPSITKELRKKIRAVLNGGSPQP